MEFNKRLNNDDHLGGPNCTAPAVEMSEAAVLKEGRALSTGEGQIKEREKSRDPREEEKEKGGPNR